MTLFAIILQVVAVYFAYATAMHDVPAVNSFTDFGSSPQMQHKFHSYNWRLKLCFVATAFAPLCFLPFSALLLLKAGLLFISTGCIIWILFDIVVATKRSNWQVWYYLSYGNKTDRFLLSVFGEKAGIWKTALCSFLILTLNLILNII